MGFLLREVLSAHVADCRQSHDRQDRQLLSRPMRAGVGRGRRRRECPRSDPSCRFWLVSVTYNRAHQTVAGFRERVCFISASRLPIVPTESCISPSSIATKVIAVVIGVSCRDRDCRMESSIPDAFHLAPIDAQP